MKFFKIFLIAVCFILAILLFRFIFEQSAYFNLPIFDSMFHYSWKYFFNWIFVGLYLIWRIFIDKKPSKQKDVIFLMALMLFNFAFNYPGFDFSYYEFRDYILILSYLSIGVVTLWRVNVRNKYQKYFKISALLASLYFFIGKLFLLLRLMSDNIESKDNILSIGLTRGLVWFAGYASLFIFSFYFLYMFYCLWQELKLGNLLKNTSSSPTLH